MKTRTNLFNRLQRNFLRCLTSGVFILGGIGGVSAQPLLDPVELLSDFVGVDTVNPPGNEANAVAFYARYLDELGIAYETGESAPGRGNLWASLKGGAAPGSCCCSIPTSCRVIHAIGYRIHCKQRFGTVISTVAAW